MPTLRTRVDPSHPTTAGAVSEVHEPSVGSAEEAKRASERTTSRGALQVSETTMHVCSKCGVARPLTDDFFRPINGTDRFHAACRECMNASARQRWAARRRATGVPCACGCGEYPVTLGARYVLGHFHPKGTYGRVTSAPSTLHPTSLDIAWAAGIYEGEGSAGYSGISVSQSDRWILDRFQTLFGGKVSYEQSIEMHFWRASGARARGFLMTIYRFLSPWRQAKAADTIRMMGTYPRRRTRRHRDPRPRVFPARRRRAARTNTL